MGQTCFCCCECVSLLATRTKFAIRHDSAWHQRHHSSFFNFIYVTSCSRTCHTIYYACIEFSLTLKCFAHTLCSISLLQVRVWVTAIRVGEVSNISYVFSSFSTPSVKSICCRRDEYLCFIIYQWNSQKYIIHLFYFKLMANDQALQQTHSLFVLT